MNDYVALKTKELFVLLGAGVKLYESYFSNLQVNVVNKTKQHVISLKLFIYLFMENKNQTQVILKHCDKVKKFNQMSKKSNLPHLNPVPVHCPVSLTHPYTQSLTHRKPSGDTGKAPSLF